MKNNTIKVFMLFFTGLIITSLAIVDSIRNSNELAEQQYAVQNIGQMFILPKNENISIKQYEIDKLILEEANKLDLNFFKRTTNRTYAKNKKGEPDIFNYQTDVYYFLSNSSKSNVYQLFNRTPIRLKNDEFLSTSKSDSKQQKGLLEKGKNGEVDYTINTIHSKESQKGHEAIYGVETLNEKNSTIFLKNVMNAYNIQFNTEFSISDLKVSKSEEFLSLKQVANKYSDITIFSIFLCIFTVIYIMISMSVIGIHKLNGYSSISVLYKLLIRSNLFLSVALVLFLYMSRIFTLGSRFLMDCIVYLSIYYFVLFIVLRILFYFSITEQLNKKDFSRYIFGSLYVVKMIVLLMTVSSIQSLVQTILYDYQESHVKDTSEYGSLYPSYIGYNFQDIINGTETTYDDINRAIYKYVEENNGILMDSSDYFSEEDYLNRVIRVNPEYVKQNSIYDQNNKIILTQKLSKHLIVLVSTKYQDKENEIKNKYQKISDNYSIHWIQLNQKLPIYDGRSTLITEPIIIEIQTPFTELIASYPVRSIAQGNGTLIPLKIPIEHGSAETYQKLYPMLKKYKVEDNFPMLKTLEEINRIEERFAIGEDSIQQVSWASLMTLFSCLLIIYSSSLYFFKNKRKISILKLHGYGHFIVYRKLIVATIVQFIVVSLLLFSYPNYGIIAVLYFVFETLVLCICMNRLEKKNKYLLLEGD
ncbi:DUF1430 domain-containing protein [Carnobacterium gallinarum]|uniref:DUF1430 domain-containing protein n=1 Tax=Carnobacterium gallinarum TaxID=2749 RepID=UPI000555D200|nr:DUF1430 domain-containing protein [Carnobacterium gallinarum]